MSDKDKKTEADRQVENEIRRGRSFSLAEAVGRQAAGALKGASPVTPARQLLLEAETLLEAHLDDAEGSLLRTLLTRLESDPPLLARHFGDAPGAMAELIDTVLASPSLLAGLVRDTDARWGRDYGETPHFNLPGRHENPDDPYTPGSVEQALRSLRQNLA